jgi:UDP-N-acetylmuramoyl-L-alanyl-D-glutamate--2,6-diaminopimelate ligase
MVVIGVTGTAGKSTVVYLIAKMLDQAGYRVGATSTLFFKVGKKEWLNNKKMTMPGRFELQKMLSDMSKANCQYAIIETTSQGIEQFRHAHINYDILVFTNLYPEHIEAHGGFDNYKKAKLKLFSNLKDCSYKVIANQEVPKIIIANLDDEHAPDFLNHEADLKYGYTTTNNSLQNGRIVRAEKIGQTISGGEFVVENTPFHLSILGKHNIYNTLAAITVGSSQGLSLNKMSEIFSRIPGVPGRLEFINEGQPFKIIIDYAFEPKAVEKLYEVAATLPHEKIIHVLGSTGGGRDVARRSVLGKIAGQKADYVIVTNEDPYDDDPQSIIDQVAAGAAEAGKKSRKDLFKYLDRRKAINKALSLAGPNDLVLITGKGSEQAMVVKNNKKIPWDDRQVTREELKKINNHNLSQ